MTLLHLNDDPSPVVVTNPGGASPFLLVGDHAGRAIPKALADLGVSAADMDRHIAWDIGVAGMGDLLAKKLDATFVRQTYSRLVMDCNRVPGAPDRAPTISDGTVVPGNADLNEAAMALRHEEIYAPYQAAIADALDGRTFLVSLHSFTPVMNGFVRPWRFGVLHRGDSVLSDRMLVLLRAIMGEACGDNQPYAMNGQDNTVPLHADGRGIDYLELEIRQDLIADAAGQEWAAEVIAQLLPKAIVGL